MNIPKRELILGFLVLCAAALIGFWWEDILENPYRAVAVLTFTTLWSLCALLIRTKQIRYGVAIGSAGVIAVTLGINMIVLAGASIGALGLLWAFSDSERQ